jgi:ABC-2 type transport system permease protein
MPLHNLSYRPWKGKLVPRFLVWWSIAETGANLAFTSRWFRRLLLLAWLPIAYLGFGLYVFEMSAEEPGLRDVAVGFLRNLAGDEQGGSWLSRLQRGDIAEQIRNDRHLVWKLLLYTFFRYPQAIVMVVMVGMLAPPLIARDLRSRAYLLYFSRPIHIWEYIAGKAFVVLKYLIVITALPAFLLYLVGLAVAQDPLAISHTWDLPLRILGATLLLTVPTTLLALAISATFTEVRYGIFAWFGIWIVGWVIYANSAISQYASGDPIVSSKLSLFSLFHVLGNVQSWCFNVRHDATLVLPSLAILGMISGFSTYVLYRRVTHPIRA